MGGAYSEKCQSVFLWNSVCFFAGCIAAISVCLLYTSDAADEEDSVDLGGRRLIKKKKKGECCIEGDEGEEDRGDRGKQYRGWQIKDSAV